MVQGHGKGRGLRKVKVKVNWSPIVPLHVFGPYRSKSSKDYMFQQCKKYYIGKRIFEFLEILNLHMGKVWYKKWL